MFVRLTPTGALFLAFQVRDQLVYGGDRNDTNPIGKDSVEVFINGDHVANDLTPVFQTTPNGNREGFQLTADGGGHQYTNSVDFTNADWKAGTSRTADGYIIEFEVPLTLIDTKDGRSVFRQRAVANSWSTSRSAMSRPRRRAGVITASSGLRIPPSRRSSAARTSGRSPCG